MILLDWTKPASMVCYSSTSDAKKPADPIDQRIVILAVVDYRLGREVNKQ